ncbi:MAG: homogentisate 1,2-dioxygenase [Acidobacteriota bacterium]|jgi:homogentisate 1,2-dioxygenase
MIHRLQRGVVPEKPHTALEEQGGLAFEHCFTRQGFDGAYTIMYQKRPPHWITREEDLGPHPGFAEPSWDGALRRRHFLTGDMEEGGTPFLSRRLILANEELGVWIARPDTEEPTLVANGDADELTYVHEGRGRVDSPLGTVWFEAGDYVYMPRALPHRWRPDGKAYLMVLEGKSFIDIPKQFRNPSGQLRMDAPYSHRDFKEPDWPEEGPGSLSPPRRLLTLRRGRVTAFEMAHNPFDILGWDGEVWPFAFPIRKFQPKTSIVHLPPTIHTTFAGGGFVVCSFVPRKVDYHEKAIPCPYPHSSVDCDEILFYVEGNFTSRKGIGPGSVSLHPAGLPHGPHPGTYEASIGTERTDEMAVMVDTFRPLAPTEHARKDEDPGYNRSWVEKD